MQQWDQLTTSHVLTDYRNLTVGPEHETLYNEFMKFTANIEHLGEHFEQFVITPRMHVEALGDNCETSWVKLQLQTLQVGWGEREKERGSLEYIINVNRTVEQYS